MARDILADICDVGVANSYYVGLMRSGAGGPEQQEWGDAIKVILPTFADGAGTHVNISGAAVAKNAPNKENAVKLLEFLVSPEAQAIYAKANFEYPVLAGAEIDPIIAELGELKIDPLPLHEIARAPQGGERARRQGRLRPGDVRRRRRPGRDLPPPMTMRRQLTERAGPHASRVRPASGYSCVARRRSAGSIVRCARRAALPLGGLVYFAARGSGDVWPHLDRQRAAARAAHDRAAARSASARWWRSSASARPGSSPCSAFRAGASSNGRCSCRSPCRPTSSPTPISTCCIRSGRCRRRSASFSASRGRATSGSRRSARSRGCIFLLGVVLYPYVYLPVRALFLMQSAATLEVARTLGAEPLARLLPRRAPAGPARRSRSASASR